MTPLNLLLVVEPTIAAGATAAGTTDINGNVIDMAGYEAVLAIVATGAATDTGTLIVKGQTGDASDGSDMTDITGAATAVVTESGGNLDNKYVCLEVVKPLKRYFRIVIDRGVANIVIEHATYIRHGATRTPTPLGTVVASKVYSLS